MEPNDLPTNEPRPVVRKLYRSPSERQLAGVCGGVADYTATDPTVIRVLFIVLALMGPGLLLYPLMWVFVPEAPTPVSEGQQPQPMASGAMSSA